MYLEVGFQIDTFGEPNPQLTPIHETLCDTLKKYRAKIALTKNQKLSEA
ncbi:MAG: hypothetical protein H7250_00640 [Flavobacterium sp.]|nr:hypothetical protein [Flavobacterium sp.]